MTFHHWSEDDFDWGGLGKAIDFIDKYITRWGRIQLHQSKEKFGTARIYCHIGITMFHDLIHPRGVRCLYLYPITRRLNTLSWKGTSLVSMIADGLYKPVDFISTMLWSLDCRYGSKFIAWKPISRCIITPMVKWQCFIYRRAYKLAVRKWPNLREEITCAADYSELLKGL